MYTQSWFVPVFVSGLLFCVFLVSLIRKTKVNKKFFKLFELCPVKKGDMGQKVAILKKLRKLSQGLIDLMEKSGKLQCMVKELRILNEEREILKNKGIKEKVLSTGVFYVIRDFKDLEDPEPLFQGKLTIDQILERINQEIKNRKADFWDICKLAEEIHTDIFSIVRKFSKRDSEKLRLKDFAEIEDSQLETLIRQ